MPALETLGVSASDAAAYGSGAILHADALRQGAHALVDLDVAFSGSAFSSAVPSKAYTNEVSRLVSPKLAANAAHGRGSALELGIGSDPIPLIGQLSETSAPPSTSLLNKVIGPLGIPGVLTADLLRSQSQSRARDGGCVLGADQSFGLGSVLNLTVLNGLLTTSALPPRREVSQSGTTTRIVPGSEPGRLGLKSETRQTIAPVTFFRGTPAQFSVEVLGEWALRAVADGAKGDVSYGPLTTSPETPVLRILGDHGQVLGQLTTQQLVGQKGLEIVIPGVAEVVLGEDPRAIGGDAASNATVLPTQASAAVDVVRVKLLTGTLADVRIGHMEAAVAVPAGGVQCPGVQVVHTVDKPTVTPGGDFVYIVNVTNPNDCDLVHLKLVDTPTAAAGVLFAFLGSIPNIANLSDIAATFPDIGGLDPGQTKTFAVKVKIPLGSKTGLLKALARATGICPGQPQPPTDVTPTVPGADTRRLDDIMVAGEDDVTGPTVGICTVPDLSHLTADEAKAKLTAAGCDLGTVFPGPSITVDDNGKVTDQSAKPDTTGPVGTKVDITVGNPVSTALAGPVCTVPTLVGLSEADARAKVEAQGCVLKTDTRNTSNPADVGKVLSQSPDSGMVLAKGS
ncbi:MAG TPA: PASTA domain-containing protein, partial [Acidimicrobiia bacterium]